MRIEPSGQQQSNESSYCYVSKKFSANRLALKSNGLAKKATTSVLLKNWCKNSASSCLVIRGGQPWFSNSS